VDENGVIKEKNMYGKKRLGLNVVEATLVFETGVEARGILGE